MSSLLSIIETVLEQRGPSTPGAIAKMMLREGLYPRCEVNKLIPIVRRMLEKARAAKGERIVKTGPNTYWVFSD